MINQVIYNRKAVPQVNFGGSDDFSELMRASYIQHCGFWEVVIYNQEDVKLAEGSKIEEFRKCLTTDQCMAHP